MGFGDSALTRYLGAIFLGTHIHLPISLGVPICNYVVAQAKKYVQWCGGETHLIVMTDEGQVHEQVSGSDIDSLCDTIEYAINEMLTATSMLDIDEDRCIKLIRNLRELVKESTSTFNRFIPSLPKASAGRLSTKS